MKIEIQTMMIEKAATVRQVPKTDSFRSLLSDDASKNNQGKTEIHTTEPAKEPEQTELAREADQADESSEEQAANSETQDENQDEQGGELTLAFEVQPEEDAILGFEETLVESIGEDAIRPEVHGIALAAEVVAASVPADEVTPSAQKEAPLISDWSQAFSARTLDDSSGVSQEFQLETAAQKAGEASVDSSGLSGGAIKLPQGFAPLLAEAQLPVDLAQPKALQQLSDLVTLQIKASQSPEGAKRLTLLLSPEGLGRMRILAESDQGRIRVQLKVEQGDAARLIEALLPHLEAQIAASTAMPVEFDLIQEDRLGEGDEAANPSLDGDSEEADGGAQNTDADLIDEWNQALEDPVLERGQTLHVVA